MDIWLRAISTQNINEFDSTLFPAHTTWKWIRSKPNEPFHVCLQRQRLACRWWWWWWCCFCVLLVEFCRFEFCFWVLFWYLRFLHIVSVRLSTYQLPDKRAFDANKNVRDIFRKQKEKKGKKQWKREHIVCSFFGIVFLSIVVVIMMLDVFCGFEIVSIEVEVACKFSQSWISVSKNVVGKSFVGHCQNGE